MIIWRRSGGCNDTTPRCRSRNIANNTFSEGWLQDFLRICRFADGPASHRARNTANTTLSCRMVQKAGFGTIPWGGGGGGGVVANREPGSYIYIYTYIIYIYVRLPEALYKENRVRFDTSFWHGRQNLPAAPRRQLSEAYHERENPRVTTATCKRPSSLAKQ